MIVNNEDYYYLPGVAKAIKDFLGRYDLVKMDVPELLVELGYDYDLNTIPYETHGRQISLYKKSSIPELLNLPGNRYKANQIIARLSAKRKAQQNNINVFGMSRGRPRRSIMSESLNEELKFDLTLKHHNIKRIIKIYSDKNDPKNFIVYDGACYYNADCNNGFIMVCIDQNSSNLINHVIKMLKTSYSNHNVFADISSNNGRVKIKIDKQGTCYNGQVVKWMKDKGFVYDINVSHDEYLEFYLNTSFCNDDVSMLKSYDDCTDVIMKHAGQLSPMKLIENLDKIYNHIVNRNTVFQIGNDKNNGGYPIGIEIVGKLKDEYPDGVTQFDGTAWDKRLKDQYIFGYGMLPGLYKCESKGKPCTMIVKEKQKDDFWTKGIVYYDDDDININDYL